MERSHNSDGLGLVVVVAWLLDTGVGIGLFGQGHFLLAMLALAALPVMAATLLLAFYLFAGVFSLFARRG